MTKYTCEFCQGEFVKASNLNKHQRTAKFCLELQEEKAERDAQLTCEYCKKVLSRSDSLHRHYVSCIEYLIYQRVKVFETEINSLKERLVEKDQQIQELTTRLREVTDTSLNRTTNTYTHIGQVTINESTPPLSIQDSESTAYPLVPPARNPQEVNELINKLHHKVINVFGAQTLKQRPQPLQIDN